MPPARRVRPTRTGINANSPRLTRRLFPSRSCITGNRANHRSFHYGRHDKSNDPPRCCSPQANLSSRSVAGFPATQQHQWPRVRLSVKSFTGVADPGDMKRRISCPRQKVQQIPGCPILRAVCEGWDTTNLDTDRRVSHPLQRTQRMGHPSFCRANYRAQQNGVAILLNAGEKCRLRRFVRGGQNGATYRSQWRRSSSGQRVR